MYKGNFARSVTSRVPFEMQLLTLSSIPSLEMRRRPYRNITQSLQTAAYNLFHNIYYGIPAPLNVTRGFRLFMNKLSYVRHAFTAACA